MLSILTPCEPLNKNVCFLYVSIFASQIPIRRTTIKAEHVKQLIQRWSVLERSRPAATSRAKVMTKAPARKSGYVFMYGVIPNLSNTRSCNRLSVVLSIVAVIARLKRKKNND